MNKNDYEAVSKVTEKARELQELRITFFNMYMDEWLKEGPTIGSETATIKIEVNGRTLTFDYVKGCDDVFITDGGDMLLYDHVENEIKYTLFHYEEGLSTYLYVLHDDSKEEIVSFNRDDNSMDAVFSYRDYLLQD